MLEDTQEGASELGWHESADAFAKEKLASSGDLRGGKAGLMVVVNYRIRIMEREGERGVEQSMWGIGRMGGG